MQNSLEKIRVSAVSYTNTKAFVYGITESDILKKIDLSLDIPSECAQKLIDNHADIGLVPVAALLNIPDYHILGDYCIGAVGPVNSVFIFSHKPIEEVRTIRFDKQSRTSNNLAKVLLKNYWKQSPEHVEDESADAFVEIGDRTFGKKNQYPFVYDLAEEWIKFTGLPFAFAVWAANKPIPQDFVSEFNTALKLGLDNRDKVIAELPKRDDFDFEKYLMHNLNFDLDADKRKALNLFLDYIKAL